MNVQLEHYARVRPNPRSRDDSPRQGWRPPTPTQHRWLRASEWLALIVALSLLMLAGCSTTPPVAVERPQLPLPRLTPPQFPETLPDRPLMRAVLRGSGVQTIYLWTL